MLPRRIVIVAMTAITVLLAGCASSAVSPGSTLTFWAYEPNSKAQKDALETLVAAFEGEHGAEVKITYVPKDSFNTKLNSAIAVGRNPDVSYLDQPLTPRFVADGLLLDVTSRLNAGIGSESFYPAAMKTATIDGRVYAVPLSMTTVCLFYNKALVAEPPSTWDEWVESARDVYSPGEVAAFEGIGSGGYSGWIFPALVHSGGGSMVNNQETTATFGEETGIEAAKLLVALQSYSDQSIRESQNSFGNGDVAYNISGPWDIAALQTNFPDLDFGVALIPASAGHESISSIGGENLVVFANSAQHDLAYEFVEYLTNANGQNTMAGVTGDFATNLGAAVTIKYTSDPYLSVFLEQMKTAVARPALKDWLKVNDEIIGFALDQILVSGADPAVVLTEANSHANEVLFG